MAHLLKTALNAEVSLKALEAIIKNTARLNVIGEVGLLRDIKAIESKPAVLSAVWYLINQPLLLSDLRIHFAPDLVAVSGGLKIDLPVIRIQIGLEAIHQKHIKRIGALLKKQ